MINDAEKFASTILDFKANREEEKAEHSPEHVRKKRSGTRWNNINRGRVRGRIILFWLRWRWSRCWW
uniref:Putative ovule protein n=1 Tax=Solanum chacoense TaxID=4108 RepID=A0A0V0GDP1_SOLCH